LPSQLFGEVSSNSIEYGVELQSSFFDFVYDNVVEPTSKKAEKSGGTMTRKEALNILFLEDGFEKEDLKKIYRKTTMKYHPDR